MSDQNESAESMDDDELASHLAIAMVEAGNPSQYPSIGEHAKAIVKALRRQQKARIAVLPLDLDTPKEKGR